MTCAGQPAEEYQLYALGILEETDREQIRTHLSQGCETCLAGVRQSNRFWSIFGTGSALLTLVTPPARLRRKILAAVTPSQPSWLGLFWLSGKQVAGIAALLMLTATGTWFITRQPARIQTVPETRTITEVRPDPAQQQEIERLQQQLDAARRAAPGTAPAAAVTALERELAQARSSAGDAGQALTQERARAAQSEAQLREQIRVQTVQL
ncbi:MAG: hypothetical protein ACRD8O_00975, partial [Bryobacteraceae bacterium]